MADPEEVARIEIDALLALCNWTVQDRNAVNLAASRGVAVRELTSRPTSRIVTQVERTLSVIEELEMDVNANLQRVTRLRQSILQWAFTGEKFL